MDNLETVAREAAYRVYAEWEWDQLAARDVTDAIAAAVLSAVEPLIRDEALAIARHESWGAAAGQRDEAIRADLRAKVAGLPVRRMRFDLDAETVMLLRSDVLALLGGSGDG